jgi:RNA polymerase sigma-70 factor, ECF subfamily
MPREEPFAGPASRGVFIDGSGEMSRGTSEFSPALAAIVRQKARQVVRRPGFTSGEFEDIAQTLSAKLVQGFSKFDEQRGTVEALAQVAANRCVASLIRERNAAKRGLGSTVSLQATIKLDDGECGELAATIGKRELVARTSTGVLNEQFALEMKLDVSAVLAQLPHADRQLMHRLKWKSVAQVARDLGIPPTTIHSRLSKYRQQFEDDGLKEYLR